jgi:excisionase family DNA binding protein
MNFADAIRKVSVDPQTSQALGLESPVRPSGPVAPASVSVPAPAESVTTDGHDVPSAPNPAVHSGNVVRLELFLSAEQMGGLFRAIMAGQHTVMTAREAASYLRLSKERLMKLAEEGEIPGVVIDGRWRFPKPNLDDWLTMHSHVSEEAEDVA